MVLVDSSSWIHFFNRTDASICSLVGALIREDEVTTCGPVLTEVLSGAKNRAEFNLLREQFDLLPFLALDKRDFHQAGELRSRLRMKGVRVKTVDALIAHLTLREKSTLLHHDSDYTRIARWFPLRILPGSLGSS